MESSPKGDPDAVYKEVMHRRWQAAISVHQITALLIWEAITRVSSARTDVG